MKAASEVDGPATGRYIIGRTFWAKVDPVLR